MAENFDLNKTDASNTARFPENQNPSTLNDGARALEGILARAFKDCLEPDLDSTGSSNAYVVAANRTVTAYFDGLRIGFHANHACTGASTLNIDSVGAKAIKKNHDQDLASGDIEQHQFVEVVYSASDDAFQMISPVANAPLTGSGNQTITSTDAGAAEGPTLSLHRDSASPADADILGAILFKGEDDGSAATTYASIQAVADDVTDATEDGTLNLQTMVAGTLATRASVKAGIVVGSATGGDQGAGTINATGVYVNGVAVTAAPISAGTQLVKNPIAANSVTTQAHGLSGEPKYVKCVMECVSADNSWDVGDRVDISASILLDQNNATRRGISVQYDATNVILQIDDTDGSGSGFTLPDEDGTSGAPIAIAKWKIEITPYYWA